MKSFIELIKGIIMMHFAIVVADKVVNKMHSTYRRFSKPAK